MATTDDASPVSHDAQQSSTTAGAGDVSGSGAPAGGFLRVQGPVDADATIIAYDVAYAPADPKKTAKYRQRLGLPPVDPRGPPDPNARAIIDGMITPREWEEGGTRWVQHASPYPAPRIDVVATREKLQTLMQQRGARTTGVCPIRTFLHGECFTEVIRQVVAESWERGLLLLKVHAERVMAQRAHRELFESRCGYALRMALKGEKDTASMVARIEMLRAKKEMLTATEEEYKKKCEDIKGSSEIIMRDDEFRHNAELAGFKKEATQKKALLEALTAPTKKIIAATAAA